MCVILCHVKEVNVKGTDKHLTWHLSINSSPSAAYMLRWTRSALVQIMACRLIGAKPLPEPTLTYCQLDPKEQTSVKFESRYGNFIPKNAFQNVVCEMADNLSRERWVTDIWYNQHITNMHIYLMRYPAVVAYANTSKWNHSYNIFLVFSSCQITTEISCSNWPWKFISRVTCTSSGHRSVIRT